MSTNADQDSHQHVGDDARGGHRRLSYRVNGEVLHTSMHELAVREILTDAGFTLVEDYRLSRDRDNHVFDDYGTEVRIHEGERFTATFLGATPTS